MVAVSGNVEFLRKVEEMGIFVRCSPESKAECFH